jgi:hypothetical protein
MERFIDMWSGGEVPALPSPANENLVVKPDWQTPAEALQLVRRWKERSLREHQERRALWHCSAARLDWEIARALERCLLWTYYRRQ